MAIHVLSDVAGQEIELLAFDCFDQNAHYHYGPRNQNVVLQWDRTVVPDPLQWTLDQFKGGNLGGMLQRAGYPSIVAELDGDLVRRVVAARGGAGGPRDAGGQRRVAPRAPRRGGFALHPAQAGDDRQDGQHAERAEGAHGRDGRGGPQRLCSRSHRKYACGHEPHDDEADA